jgi:hypothetical protein
VADVLVRIGADLKEFEASKELDRAFSDISKSAAGFGTQLGKVVSGPLAGLTGSLSGIAKLAASPVKAAGGIFDMLGGVGMGVFGIKNLADGIGGVLSGMVSGNAEMERYETQLGTLMGSSDKAKDRLAELAKFGAETPFELPEIVRAEKVLLGFGLTGQKVFQMTGKTGSEFRSIVGDIAAGTGAQFEEIALNMGKFSAGATGEAISRFQEMGIATREQMAAMGVQFAKSGELLSPIPVAMAAVVKLSQEKFGGGMAKLSKTFEGQMSTLSDNFNQAKIQITAPIFDVLKEALAGVNTFLSSGTFQRGLQSVASLLAGAVKEGIAFVVDGFGRLRGMIEPFLPILRTLGQYFDIVVFEGDAFNDFLGHLPEPFRLVTKVVGVVVSNLREVFDLFGRLAAAAQLALGGDFSGAMAAAGDALHNFASTVLSTTSFLVQDIIRAITEALPGIVATLGEWGAAFVGWIVEAVPKVIEALMEFAGKVLDWVIETAPKLLAQLGEWKDAFLDWIVPIVASLPAKLGKIKDAIAKWITESGPKLLEDLIEFGEVFVQWVGFKIEPMLKELGRLKDEALTWIGEQAKPILDQLGKWGQSFVDWIGPAADKFVEEWPTHLTKFLDWIEFTAAPAIVDTLSSWITAFTDWIGGEGEGGAAGGIGASIGKVAEVIYKFIEGTVAVLGPRLQKWGLAFLGWIGETVIPALPGILWSIVTKIVEVIGDLIPVIFEAAKGLGVALARGIISGLPAPQALKDLILGFLGGAGGAAAPNLPPANAPPSQWTKPPTGKTGAWVNGVPIAASGGLVTSSGLAMVHAAEIIGPIDQVRGQLGGGIDYTRLARALATEIAGLNLSVSVDDVHGALIRKGRRNAGLGIA